MILIVSYGGGHIRIAEQVYHLLKQEGRECVLLPLTTAEQYVFERGIPFLELSHLFEQYTRERLDNIPAEQKRFIDEESSKNYNHPKVSNKHTYAYYFLGLTELFDKYGFSKGKEKYLDLNRRAFEPIHFSSWVIQKYNCQLIITTNVDRFEYSFRAAGKMLKLGVVSFDDLFGEFADPQKIQSDLVCVDNETAKNNIQKMGYNGKIAVTGNPVFNHLQPNKSSIEIENSVLIVLTTGISGLKLFENFKIFDDNFFENFFSSIEDYLLKKYSLVKIRFHPSMTPKKYWRNNSFEIDNEIDFHCSLKKAEIVLGLNCTTAIYEAYLSGKSIINFNYTNKANYRNLPIPALGYVNSLGFIEEINLDDHTNLKLINTNRRQNTENIIELIDEILYNN